MGLDAEEKPLRTTKAEKAERAEKAEKAEKPGKSSKAAAKTKPESSQGTRRRVTQEYTASTISGIAVSWPFHLWLGDDVRG